MVTFHGEITVLDAVNRRLLDAVKMIVPDLQADRYSDIFEDETGLYIQIAEEHLSLLTPAEINNCKPFTPTMRTDG